MKHTSQSRLTATTILSLLLLLAFAVGAQAAAAAHFSDGSAATTVAGTQGRGGVDASQLAAVSASSPVAGTAGRGGVAELPGASTASAAPASRPAGTVAFAFSRPRGGSIPVPQAGNVPRAAVTTAPLSSSDWVTLAVIAAIAALAGVAVYASRRRRSGQNRAALASYCTYHPTDSLCGTA